MRKKTLKSLKRELWELCKQLTRKNYGNRCYTCPKGNLETSNWHTGHFIPSSTCGLALRYSLENLRPQCYNCNINLGGNGAEFYRCMVIQIGKEAVEKIFQEKNKITKWSLTDYQNKIDEYTKCLNQEHNY